MVDVGKEGVHDPLRNYFMRKEAVRLSYKIYYIRSVPEFVYSFGRLEENEVSRKIQFTFAQKWIRK